MAGVTAAFGTSRSSGSKDSDQTETAPRKFKLGPLANLNQVTKGLAKTILADRTLDSQVGARICNGLGLGLVVFVDNDPQPFRGGGTSVASTFASMCSIREARSFMGVFPCAQAGVGRILTRVASPW